jgi:hypothetical protein
VSRLQLIEVGDPASVPERQILQRHVIQFGPCETAEVTADRAK